MDLVHNILKDFVELGFVEISGGELVQTVLPIFNLYTYNKTSVVYPDRWDVTIQYLKDYAHYHTDFEGYYFLSLYDGWREYSEPVDPNTIFIPWQDVQEVEKGSHFTFGNSGEPRFKVNPSNHSLHIELPFPILTYNRHIGDSGVLLIPDSEFLKTSFKSYKDQVDQFDIPFNEKLSTMIWRGAYNVNSGYAYVVHPLRDIVEINATHPRTLAEAISAEVPSFGGIFNVSFDHLSIEVLLKYKYQLDIDGMVSAWSAFYWKMYSNSAVIKCPSHWEQWYYQDLVPFEHYLPLKSFHPSDIHALYEWCETNSGRCEEIGRRGSEYVRRLTYQYAVEEYIIH